MGGVVKDHQQFCQYSVLCYFLQCNQLGSNDRPRLLYEFIQSVGVLCFDAFAHHSIEDGARNNRLIEHVEDLVADIEEYEPSQKVKPAQTLLVDDLVVDGLFQFVIQLDTQVLVGHDDLHVTPIDEDRRIGAFFFLKSITISFVLTTFSCRCLCQHHFTGPCTPPGHPPPTPQWQCHPRIPADNRIQLLY